MQYSVVNYKTVKENSDFRIDGEYYHPSFLDLELKIEKLKNKSFGNLVKEIRCGPFGSTVLKDTYLEDGVIVARPFNLLNYSLERSNLVFIDENDLKKGLKVYQEGDIFFSRVGDVRCGVVPKFDRKITISPNIIAVKVRTDIINPYYATVFFNSKFGFPQIVRGLKVVAQPTIQTNLIAKLKIVLLDKNFQETIETIFVKSLNFQNDSKSLYSQAEQLLLSELGLLDWKPKHELVFVKNFSATQQADRFDAEYFQPKYEEIIEAVKKYKGGFVTLGQVAKTKRGSLIPDSFYNEKSGTPYIRGADFSSGFLSVDKLIYIDDSFHQKSETKIKKGDIVFALIGTVGSTALIDDNFNGAFMSNNLGKIIVETYNSTILQVLLHSIVGKLYFEKERTQTAQPKISDKDIHNFILPKLENKIEKDIEQKYFESQKNKKISKSLLEIAKRGVEMAIEKDEQEAGKWIENQLTELGIAI